MAQPNMNCLCCETGVVCRHGTQIIFCPYYYVRKKNCKCICKKHSQFESYLLVKNNFFLVLTVLFLMPVVVLKNPCNAK